MKTLGYYNGSYGEIEDMRVPMSDRVCFFGDGVYDATYSRNYKIYALDDHLDRFFDNTKQMGLQLTCNREELKDILGETVKKLDTGNQFVYWQATRGTEIRNHAYDPALTANLWILLKPAEIKDVTQKIKVITLEDTRYLHCNVKTLNLLPNILAAQKAESLGCAEAVFHRSGRVTECAHSNVSILKDGRLMTAPADRLILPGITRMRMIRVCKKLHIPVEETPYTLKELFEADEVIVTSAGQLAIGVSEIDFRPAGGRALALLKTIQDALLAELYEETEDN